VPVGQGALTARHPLAAAGRRRPRHPLYNCSDFRTEPQGAAVPTIVVEVMPKAEILDPQGKAVVGALARLGKTDFTGVRIGKRFELTTAGPVDEAVLAEVHELAGELLSNSVIEDVVSIEVLDASTPGETH
jgi:phosphoribosylformylglycinamidine synthase